MSPLVTRTHQVHWHIACLARPHGSCHTGFVPFLLRPTYPTRPTTQSVPFPAARTVASGPWEGTTVAPISGRLLALPANRQRNLLHAAPTSHQISGRLRVVRHPKAVPIATGQAGAHQLVASASAQCSLLRGLARVW